MAKFGLSAWVKGEEIPESEALAQAPAQEAPEEEPSRKDMVKMNP